jgi:CubicO group peptidase (beta-lactamase class C family)
MAVEVHGRCDETFAAVREAFALNLENEDLGATFAVTVEGETVIDLWGGYQDHEKLIPWEKDTITNVYSTTKTMAALTVLMLADRGDIDLYEPVATYWPEFAQNGKDKIATRHFLSHSAGLAGLDERVSEEDLYDHRKIAELLASQKPWWEPGTASGYHAATQGYLLGEVVRRVTGKTLGTLFAEEIAAPLDADFYIGTPAEQDHKVAPLWPPIDPDHHMLNHAAPSGSVGERVGRSPACNANWARTVPWRRAEIPAANGHGNARSVAEIHAILANGGMAKGKRFMSEEGPKRIFDVQTQGEDLVFERPAKFGMGFGLNGEKTPVGPNPNTCYWGGWGGSFALVDLDAHTTISYVMNQMVQQELNAVDQRIAGLIGGFAAGLHT